VCESEKDWQRTEKFKTSKQQISPVSNRNSKHKDQQKSSENFENMEAYTPSNLVIQLHMHIQPLLLQHVLKDNIVISSSRALNQNKGLDNTQTKYFARNWIMLQWNFWESNQQGDKFIKILVIDQIIKLSPCSNFSITWEAMNPWWKLLFSIFFFLVQQNLGF
jgi:hypothetical protein